MDSSGAAETVADAGLDGLGYTAAAESAHTRDQAAIAGFIERFSAVLVDAGIPRMPARVFVALLTSDSGRLTAAELSQLLSVSPAAVSGGVRYLAQVGMIRREGEPGSRKHHYRVPDDVWHELMVTRNRLMRRWTTTMREGIDLLGADSPAGLRMTEAARYFEFVESELPLVLASWERQRRR